MPHCKQTKEDGTPCQTNAMAGSDYCFFHDPAKADEREAARRAGGSVGKTAVLPSDTPDVPLSSVADVIALLGRTVNQVRRGQIDPKVANAIGYLTGTLLRALEQGDIEKRVAELEALVKGHAAPESVFDEDLEGDMMKPDLPVEVTA
jgi:hypothetical protein